MWFNNAVTDLRGRCIGYRCHECGAIRPSMWGNVCNECRERERRHQELIAAIQSTPSSDLLDKEEVSHAE